MGQGQQQGNQSGGAGGAEGAGGRGGRGSQTGSGGEGHRDTGLARISPGMAADGGTPSLKKL